MVRELLAAPFFCKVVCVIWSDFSKCFSGVETVSHSSLVGAVQRAYVSLIDYRRSCWRSVSWRSHREWAKRFAVALVRLEKLCEKLSVSDTPDYSMDLAETVEKLLTTCELSDSAPLASSFLLVCKTFYFCGDVEILDEIRMEKTLCSKC